MVDSHESAREVAVRGLVALLLLALLAIVVAWWVVVLRWAVAADPADVLVLVLTLGVPIVLAVLTELRRRSEIAKLTGQLAELRNDTRP